MKKTNKSTVKTFCYQCVAGPDLMEIEVENGIATRVESLYGIEDAHPGGGRVCVKAYGVIQKTYNPERIQSHGGSLGGGLQQPEAICLHDFARVPHAADGCLWVYPVGSEITLIA